ncbi:MAG TPA: DUF2059 domain-containing protein [Caulobacteraceae bacterium]|jgi:hypothetical protein|nr:DUF2059 domain-containing protein [Caulobacteraceae bacterium]
MNRVATGLAVLALVSASVTQVTAQPAPASSEDSAPSARKLELARQLVQMSDLKANMVAALRGMASGLASQQAAQGGQTLAPDRQAKLKAIQDAEADVLPRMVPNIVEAMVQGYAREFTEKELSDAVAFYQSPSGRAIIAKTPQLMQGVMVELVRLTPQLRRDMGEEICAKVTCTAAEKAAYFGSSPPNPEARTPPGR